MINTNPNPSYSQLRVLAIAGVVFAVTVAMTGLAGSGTVLAWAVAVISATVFSATFYLKS